jgi:hypothetical protein
MFLLILLLSSPAFAADTRPLQEVEALTLERYELQVQLLQERIARLKEQAIRYAQDIQRRDGVEGWTLNLEGRKWVKPEPPKDK